MPSIEPTVRQVMGDDWQVLLDDQQWHSCRNELDARFIAHGLKIAGEIRGGSPPDRETADELEEARAVLMRNVGACAAAQLILDAAKLARTPPVLTSHA